MYGEASRTSIIRIQYGGSANEKNIADLMSMPDIDGALIGGASLKVDAFTEMVRSPRAVLSTRDAKPLRPSRTRMTTRVVIATASPLSCLLSEKSALPSSSRCSGVVVLSQWVSRRVQIVGLRLTGDETVAQMAYYLLCSPGIVLHELSHVVMAKLLGLKVGKVSLGPRDGTTTRSSWVR